MFVRNIKGLLASSIDKIFALYLIPSQSRYFSCHLVTLSSGILGISQNVYSPFISQVCR